MSPVGYARQAPTLGTVSRGVARLAAFVVGWWLVLSLAGRVG